MLLCHFKCQVNRRNANVTWKSTLFPLLLVFLHVGSAVMYLTAHVVFLFQTNSSCSSWKRNTHHFKCIRSPKSPTQNQVFFKASTELSLTLCSGRDSSFSACMCILSLWQPNCQCQTKSLISKGSIQRKLCIWWWQQALWTIFAGCVSPPELLIHLSTGC